MVRPCCANQRFERHQDPEVADIGKAEGVEYTAGRCGSCGARLIAGFMTAAGTQCLQVVDQALLDKLLGAPAGPIRNKMLAEWDGL